MTTLLLAVIYIMFTGILLMPALFGLLAQCISASLINMCTGTRMRILKLAAVHV